MRLKPTDALALGNALHLALEEGHKRPHWSFDFVAKRFLDEFRRIIEDDEVFITWPKMKKFEAEGIEMLEAYNHGIEQGTLSSTPFAVEKEFRIPFEDEIVVVGKIDKIERDGEDYIVTDYKSGKREPDPWFLRHDLQFTTYAWALQDAVGKIPKKLVWHHLRTGKLLETERTQEDIDDLKRMLHNALEMNRQGIRYRVFHPQVCNWCDFKGAVCDDKELEARLVAQREALDNGRISNTPTQAS